MPLESRLDFEIVRTIADEFPLGSWQRINCSRLHTPTGLNPRAREWELLTHVHKKGGNYAFLFPAGHFAEEREILLDGPAQRKIPFRFSTQSHPAIEGLFVAYVGKAANLNQRFQWHFSLAEKNTGAQVQFGLVKSGICTDRQSAVDFMLKHATIVYRELSGDEHAANRDVVELSLCAKLASPFNIKSER
ncbi:MAG: hypothetical protein WCS99_13655 [Limisphaerales bacterium]